MRTKNGFTLIELMVATMISILVLLAVSSLYVSMQNLLNRQQVFTTLSEIRMNFTRNLTDPVAWGNTDNPTRTGGNPNFPPTGPSLICAGWIFAQGAGCLFLVGVQTPLVLYDSNPNGGNLFFDSTNPANGFKVDGSPCSTFSATHPDPAGCVIGLKVTWQPICGNATSDPLCQNPTMQITGTFTYNGTIKPINASASNFQIAIPLGFINGAPPPCPSAYTGPYCNDSVVCVAGTWTCEVVTPH